MEGLAPSRAHRQHPARVAAEAEAKELEETPGRTLRRGRRWTQVCRRRPLLKQLRLSGGVCQRLQTTSNGGAGSKKRFQVRSDV